MSIAFNSINSNKVNTGDKERIYSDCIQNPYAMSCKLWTGTDLAGREVCENSFNTKDAGCNSAEDRIFVENGLRPQYTNFVTLSAPGISGDGLYRNTTTAYNTDQSAARASNTFKSSPHFGTTNNSRIKSTDIAQDVASANARAQDMNSATSQQSRVRQAAAVGYQSNNRSYFGGSILPNPAGDYRFHSATNGDYVRLGQYNKGTR